ARRAGGRFLLRIEDIDRGRCREEFVAAILEDLAWLGLDWEEPVRRQSAHMDDYAAALARLEAMGLVYPCICTRREIAAEIAASASAPHGSQTGAYPGTCRRRREAGEDVTEGGRRPFALRLDCARAIGHLEARGVWPLSFIEETEAAPVAVDPLRIGDVVLARKDTPASYHLAVTVDDAAQGVSHVIRGEDLRPASHVHRLLQALLALPVPRWRHHRLITDAEGRRLAKRDGAPTLRALRARGLSPSDVRGMLGF
ncbi:MAG: tRNA glutamyl-Q(34) synthetase GluQRS, partial [Alphaproteobacteria bacterium]